MTTGGPILRVICPYTRLDLRCHEALEATGWEWFGVDVSGSDRAYFDLLSDMWATGEAFAVVEHDIVVHRSALHELDECGSDWCAFPHRYMGRIEFGLGCCKFSKPLLERHPDAMIRAGVLFDSQHPKRHWCRLDAWLQGVILPGFREVRCEHLPPVGHVGRGSGHRCIS